MLQQKFLCFLFFLVSPNAEHFFNQPEDECVRLPNVLNYIYYGAVLSLFRYYPFSEKFVLADHERVSLRMSLYCFKDRKHNQGVSKPLFVRILERRNVSNRHMQEIF